MSKADDAALFCPRMTTKSALFPASLDKPHRACYVFEHEHDRISSDLYDLCSPSQARDLTDTLNLLVKTITETMRREGIVDPAAR